MQVEGCHVRHRDVQLEESCECSSLVFSGITIAVTFCCTGRPFPTLILSLGHSSSSSRTQFPPFPGKQTPGKLPISANPATGLDKGNISCKLRTLVVIRDGFIPLPGCCALVCHPAVLLGGDCLFCCLLHSTSWTVNLHLIHAVFIYL